MAVKFQASLPVSFFREGKYFVAYSPVLDLSTSGKTFAQVQKRFAEVVEIFLEELAEKGTLDEVLVMLGWVRTGDNWVPPMLVAQETSKVNITLAN